MRFKLSAQWEENLKLFDFSYQPIVSAHTGSVYGFEALLRGQEKAGFASIQSVFDRAYEDDCLNALDQRLFEKAIVKLKSTGFLEDMKIFYNLDNRVLHTGDYSPGNTLEVLKDLGIPISRVVFEISEIHDPPGTSSFDDIVAAYKRLGLRIALDDYGSGYAGLKLLYRAEPDLIKIDRFFIEGVHADARKRFFVSSVVATAHMMGVPVVAEGIETEKEFYALCEVGCDYLQGYFLGKPVLDVGELHASYSVVERLHASDRRKASSDWEYFESAMDLRPAVELGEDLLEVLKRFRQNAALDFLPVVDEDGVPVGVYSEHELRGFVYSPYGISLLRNMDASRGASSLLSKVPIVESGTRLDSIIQLFSSVPDARGVVVTKNGKYLGVLTASSLLSVIGDKNIAEARDQNPLSRLPGNLRIEKYLTDRLSDSTLDTLFAYFDFDHFKPYNDAYGFRNGDRLISLFAQILKEEIASRGAFIGHIGGDDFFVGIGLFSMVEKRMEPKDGIAPGINPPRPFLTSEEAMEALQNCAFRFSEEARAYVPERDRVREAFTGRGRDGVVRDYPLPRVSVAILRARGKKRRQPRCLWFGCSPCQGAGKRELR
jgi:EAL domain-containing protein (putative c-di-GMP-specific phosphodiesterase class I)/GGDEF domain-containing protein